MSRASLLPSQQSTSFMTASYGQHNYYQPIPYDHPVPSQTIPVRQYQPLPIHIDEQTQIHQGFAVNMQKLQYASLIMTLVCVFLTCFLTIPCAALILFCLYKASNAQDFRTRKIYIMVGFISSSFYVVLLAVAILASASITVQIESLKLQNNQ